MEEFIGTFKISRYQGRGPLLWKKQSLKKNPFLVLMIKLGWSLPLLTLAYLCTYCTPQASSHIIMGSKRLWICIKAQFGSHWHHTMVDGAKFWISCKQPAFLRSFSYLQVIQNLAPSTTVWRQCDIRIAHISIFLWHFYDISISLSP